jgi:hypothetical protein
MFIGVFPVLDRLNIMNLSSPRSAILRGHLQRADHRGVDPAVAQGREVLRRAATMLRRTAPSTAWAA